MNAVRLLESLAHPQAGLSTLSYHLDIDLSQFPQTNAAGARRARRADAY